MLAVRLSAEEEERVARFARAHGRGKSDVTRAALSEYLDRHEAGDELIRQARLIAERERTTQAGRGEVHDVDALSRRLIQDLD